MAKRMAEQMELFEPVTRGFNEGGDTSSAKDAAMQNLQSSAADKTTARKEEFNKLTNMLMSGEVKELPEEEQQKFIKLYRMMKSQGFNDGGLMDEGGTVDPVSGNDVPPGSTQEEVRDDIPAQLSEGEFVIPADVVRYIGLENLMRMRQEAKMGLAQMEEMGQMGNSEEATMPDDLPFDMYDLEVEDDGERNFNVGGYVAPTVPTNPYTQQGQVNPQTGVYQLPGTGIAGYQVPTGGQTGYTPYGGAAPYFQPAQYTGAQFQTATQTTNLPTFAETVGQKPGQYDELKTYLNDSGQILQIPFKDGKPIYPIPEGYKLQGTEETPEEAPTTVTPTLGQTQVRDDRGGDNSTGMDGKSPGGMFGGNANTMKSSAYSSAVASLGLSQLSSLSPTSAIMGKISGKPTANDIAIASNTARNTVVNDFGLPDVSAASVNQLDAIGSAMNVVSNFTNIGSISTTKTAAATVAKSIANAVATGAMSVEQADTLSDLGMDSSGAFTDQNGNSAYNEDDPGTVNPDFDADALDAINAYAEAMATDDDEDDEADDAAAAGTKSTYSALGRSPGAMGGKKSGLGQSPGAMGGKKSGLGQSPGAMGGKKSGLGQSPGAMGGKSSGMGQSPGAMGGKSSGMGQSPGAMGGKSSGMGQSPGAMGGRSNDNGGDRGGGGGGGGGGGSGCFAAGTKFFMQDGYLKSVENIKVGDIMMDGGKVRLSIVGDGSNSDWYMYGATKVTGSHPVREQGIWKFTRNAENAVPTETEDLLYTIVNANHRMVAEDKVVYSDYDMVDEDGIEEELLEMMNLQEVVEEAA